MTARHDLAKLVQHSTALLLASLPPQLPDGTFVAVVDGDSQEQGPLESMVAHRLLQLAILWLLATGLFFILRKHAEVGAPKKSDEYKPTDAMRAYW